MRYVNILLIITIFFLTGCEKFGEQGEGKALPGTNTAIVPLYIDKNGYPQASLRKVIVLPGQKIIFAGPDQFEIFFKEQRSPTDESEFRSSTGVVIIEIPKNIFEVEQRETKSQNAKDELIYNYGIRADGKVTDPEIVIRRH
jgi:hypothetical protein